MLRPPNSQCALDRDGQRVLSKGNRNRQQNARYIEHPAKKRIAFDARWEDVPDSPSKVTVDPKTGFEISLDLTLEQYNVYATS